MSNKKSRRAQRAPGKNSVRVVRHEHPRAQARVLNRERLSAKRENFYFTPFERALPKIEKTARFNPVQNRVKIPSVDLVRNDGYLTEGTFLDKIAFRNPFKQSVCVKRAQRRRVIFALNLRGKGSGAKKHKFTLTSQISCKG